MQSTHVHLAEDYEDVRYWKKSTWLAEFKALQHNTDISKTSAKTASGESRKWHFLEDSGGVLLSEARRDRMRSFARGQFNDLAGMGKDVPAKWGGEAGADSRTRIITKIEEEFTELQLCEEHWKADQVLMLVYPMWIAKRKDLRPTKVKREDPTCPGADGPVISTTSLPGPSTDTNKAKLGSVKRYRAVDGDGNSVSDALEHPVAKKARRHLVDVM